MDYPIFTRNKQRYSTRFSFSCFPSYGLIFFTFLGLLKQRSKYTHSQTHKHKQNQLKYFLWDITKDIRWWVSSLTKRISPNDISMPYNHLCKQRLKQLIFHKSRYIYPAHVTSIVYLGVCVSVSLCWGKRIFFLFCGVN